MHSFVDCDMTGTKLHGSRVAGKLFQRCNVTGLDLAGTDVSGVVFEDCTDSDMPITNDWLHEHGALNADKAIIRASLEERAAHLYLDKIDVYLSGNFEWINHLGTLPISISQDFH